jgi:hypothetical protein
LARQETIGRSVELARTGSELRIVQPAWRKPGKIGAPSAYVQVIAVSLLVGTTGALGPELIPDPVSRVVGAIFVALAVIGPIALVAYNAHTLEVRIRADGVVIERRLGSLRFMRVALRRGEIAAVAHSIGEYGNPANPSVWRDVRLRTRDNRSYAIADSVQGRAEVEALCALICAELGLGESSSLPT